MSVCIASVQDDDRLGGRRLTLYDSVCQVTLRSSGMGFLKRLIHRHTIFDFF